MAEIEIKKIINTPVFNHLSVEKLEDFLEKIPHRVEHYEARKMLAMQGTPCRAFHLLCDGKVRASMTGPDGKQVTIEDLEGPVLLAPAFVFATHNRFPVDITALTSCEVIIIGKEYFIELMQQEPIIMQNFLRILSDRSQLLTQKLGSFALLSLKSRVATYLTEHNEIRNQQEVADRMGVARPSLARVLAELANEGAVVFKNHRVLIENRMILNKYM